MLLTGIWNCSCLLFPLFLCLSPLLPLFPLLWKPLPALGPFHSSEDRRGRGGGGGGGGGGGQVPSLGPPHHPRSVEDRQEALSEGLGALLGVHVQAVVLAHPDVLVLAVGVVAGEPVDPRLAGALEAAVLPHHDVLGLAGGVPGPLQLHVGQPGQLGPHPHGVVLLYVKPGGVLQEEDLLSPAGLDYVLGDLDHGLGGGEGLGHVLVHDPVRHVLVGDGDGGGAEDDGVVLGLGQLHLHHGHHVLVGVSGLLVIERRVGVHLLEEGAGGVLQLGVDQRPGHAVAHQEVPHLALGPGGWLEDAMLLLLPPVLLLSVPGGCRSWGRS